MAQTYQETKNQEMPVFGSKGQAVSDLQNKLNNDNSGKQGYTPLNVDGIYGPKTQSAVNFNPNPNQMVVTSSQPRNQFTKDSLELGRALASFDVNGNTASNEKNQVKVDGKQTDPNNMANYSDPYTQALDKLSTNSDNATRNLIATIQAQRANREIETNKEYDRYKRGLMSLGIESGQIQSSPDMVMGHITQAENARVSKLRELDTEEAKALLEANNARDEKDFRTLKEKMDYIKQIKKDKIDTIKNTYENLKSEQGIAEIQAKQVYDVLKTLNGADKEVFLQEVAKKYNIPVGSLVAGVSQVGRDRNKKTSSGTTGSKWSELNNLLGQTIAGTDGVPFTDNEGKLTPEGFKTIIRAGIENGISRKDIIINYADKLGDNYKAYGITPVEYKTYISGTLPTDE